MLLHKLVNRGLIHPPDWLPDNTLYLTMMGSVAYGVSSDTSDCDVYGFCVPPKHVVFPHLNGEILGFGRQVKRFDQWQEYHILVDDELGGRGRNYDLVVYSIVRYFQLVMDNNPNMVDSLFTPRECVLHSTAISELVRENRHLFLHKKCWHTFKGYAYAQLAKLNNKNPEGKRKELVDKYGYDVKFAYHLIRLILEVEMILTEHDLDLRRHSEQLKAIRRGEFKEEEIREMFAAKEKHLESVYHTSTLPYGPDESKIKALLLQCLEHHYGSLDKCLVREDVAIAAIRKIKEIVNEIRDAT